MKEQILVLVENVEGTDRLSLEDGKYQFYVKDGVLKCDRYGEEWREFIGDKAVYALFEFAASVRSKK